MRRGITLGTIALVLLAVLGYCGWTAGRPPDRHEYRVTAVKTAQTAHDALQTARLAVTGLHDGPYVQVLLDDGLSGTATALRRFAALSPPDDDMRRLRDELMPLLQQALRRLTDDPAGSGPLAERLADFLERYG